MSGDVNKSPWPSDRAVFLIKAAVLSYDPTEQLIRTDAPHKQIKNHVQSLMWCAFM